MTRELPSVFDHRLWKTLKEVAAITEQPNLSVYAIYLTPAEASSFIAAIEADK